MPHGIRKVYFCNAFAMQEAVGRYDFQMRYQFINVREFSAEGKGSCFKLFKFWYDDLLQRHAGVKGILANGGNLVRKLNFLKTEAPMEDFCGNAVIFSFPHNSFQSREE